MYEDSSDTCPCALSFVHFFILDETLPLRPATPGGVAMLVPCPLSLRYINISPPPPPPPQKPSSHSPSFADKLKEMEKSKMRCCMGLFLMLLLVLAAQEAEGRMCQSRSHGFRGSCIHSHNCALVCRNEGFSGGRCHGFRRHCFCTKLC